jgi:hypothetical protein
MCSYDETVVRVGVRARVRVRVRVRKTKLVPSAWCSYKTPSSFVQVYGKKADRSEGG